MNELVWTAVEGVFGRPMREFEDLAGWRMLCYGTTRLFVGHLLVGTWVGKITADRTCIYMFSRHHCWEKIHEFAID